MLTMRGAMLRVRVRGVLEGDEKEAEMTRAMKKVAEKGKIGRKYTM